MLDVLKSTWNLKTLEDQADDEEEEDLEDVYEQQEDGEEYLGGDSNDD